MTNLNFEEVSVAAGAYISWGDKPGQAVTGKVLDFSVNGGTNFADEPCPQMQLELIEAAFSVNKSGERTDFDAGELVVVNCGLANLKRGVLAADLHRGDVVKIVLSELQPLKGGRTVKIFKIGVARGAAASAPAAAAAPASTSQATPPAANPFANPFA